MKGVLSISEGPRLDVRVEQIGEMLRPLITIVGLPRSSPQDARRARSMCLHMAATAEALSAELGARARWEVAEFSDWRRVGIELRLDDGTSYQLARLGEDLLRDVVARVGLEARRAA